MTRGSHYIETKHKRWRHKNTGNIMLDKMHGFVGMSSKQAEQISAMSECDSMVWQNFALIGNSFESLLFLLYFLKFLGRYALIEGRYALLRAGTFLIEGRVGRYVLLGAGGCCRYALLGAGTPY